MMYSIPLVSESKFLTKDENKILTDFASLCYSIAEFDVDNNKKEHIRLSVERLLHRTLNEKADVQKLDSINKDEISEISSVIESLSKTPIDSIISISDFKFPDLNKIPKDYIMSDNSVLLSYKSSVNRLIENSKVFLSDIENKLNSISRD